MWFLSREIQSFTVLNSVAFSTFTRHHYLIPEQSVCKKQSRKPSSHSPFWPIPSSQSLAPTDLLPVSIDWPPPSVLAIEPHSVCSTAVASFTGWENWHLQALPVLWPGSVLCSRSLLEKSPLFGPGSWSYFLSLSFPTQTVQRPQATQCCLAVTSNLLLFRAKLQLFSANSIMNFDFLFKKCLLRLQNIQFKEMSAGDQATLLFLKLVVSNIQKQKKGKVLSKLVGLYFRTRWIKSRTVKCYSYIAKSLSFKKNIKFLTDEF